ncbi:helix-turn-helix domain-containing protein [Rhodococcus sp. NPDC003322]
MVVQRTSHHVAGSRDAAVEGDKPVRIARIAPAPSGPNGRHTTHRGTRPAAGPAEPVTPTKQTTGAPERLWREVVGEQIRRIRTERAERLTDVAQRAGVSPQYLSEIERGVKDPSSELLAAVAGALGTTVEGLAQRAYRLAPVVPLGAAPRAATGRRALQGPVCLAA